MLLVVAGWISLQLRRDETCLCGQLFVSKLIINLQFNSF